EPRYRVVADPAASVGAGEGLTGASSAAGSTIKDTLNAGLGRDGSAAADGKRTAQATAVTSQRRHEAPTQEQRARWAAPTRRRRAAPPAPLGRYSRDSSSLPFGAAGREPCGWRGAPGRRTDWAERTESAAAFLGGDRCAGPT